MNVIIGCLESPEFCLQRKIQPQIALGRKELVGRFDLILDRFGFGCLGQVVNG